MMENIRSITFRDLANPLELGQVGCTAKAQFVCKNFGLKQNLKERNLQMQSVFRPCSNFGVSISEL